MELVKYVRDGRVHIEILDGVDNDEAREARRATYRSAILEMMGERENPKPSHRRVGHTTFGHQYRFPASQAPSQATFPLSSPSPSPLPSPSPSQTRFPTSAPSPSLSTRNAPSASYESHTATPDELLEIRADLEMHEQPQNIDKAPKQLRGTPVGPLRGILRDTRWAVLARLRADLLPAHWKVVNSEARARVWTRVSNGGARYQLVWHTQMAGARTSESRWGAVTYTERNGDIIVLRLEKDRHDSVEASRAEILFVWKEIKKEIQHHGGAPSWHPSGATKGSPASLSRIQMGEEEDSEDDSAESSEPDDGRADNSVGEYGDAFEHGQY